MTDTEIRAGVLKALRQIAPEMGAEEIDPGANCATTQTWTRWTS